jgi:hypothetical protein
VRIREGAVGDLDILLQVHFGAVCAVHAYHPPWCRGSGKLPAFAANPEFG